MSEHIKKIRSSLSILICGFGAGLFIFNLFIPLFGENLGITVINHVRMAILMIISIIIFLFGAWVSGKAEDLPQDELAGKGAYTVVGTACVAFISSILITIFYSIYF